MTISEADRREMHTRLVEVLGSGVADLLMEHLPPSGWHDIATRRDLDVLRAELRGEIAELRGEIAELRGEFGQLRGEFGQLRGEFGQLRGEMGELRGEFVQLRGEMGGLRGEMGGLRGELRAEFAAQTRTLVFSVAGMMLATVGTVAALVH